MPNKNENKQNTNLLKLPIFNDFSQLGSKIMSLRHPEKKMSKSAESEKEYLALLDEPKEIEKKIKKAKTDKLGISNLLLIYALLKKITIEEAKKEINNLDNEKFKDKLAELVCDKFKIIQEKFPLYQAKINELLEKNRLYCQNLAQQKLRKIKTTMKLIS